MQLVKLAGDMLASATIEVNKLQTDHKKLEQINSLVTKRTGLSEIQSLSNSELSLLIDLSRGARISALARKKNIRRDTLDKRLARSKEKLKVSSVHELIGAMKELSSQYRSNPELQAT